jgi:hypothetical protein
MKSQEDRTGQNTTEDKGMKRFSVFSLPPENESTAARMYVHHTVTI